MRFFLAILIVGILFCPPTHAQQSNPYDGAITRTIEEITKVEADTPDGVVLTLLCDTPPSGEQSLFYSRQCPFGSSSPDSAVSVQLDLGGADITTSFCGGAVETIQILLIGTEQELAAAGRDLRAICRDLPFDEAAVCE